jgi:NAD(P)-dependent dehydrogenase (short-subunit alcohol dehydrogenase family)/rhamnose utilization protein RhaD (predicted bifunctional aldolase and dehydrogenase)
MIKREIEDLVRISRFFGTGKDYVIAGGGNTSWKDEDEMWVKASGTSLGSIDHNGFVILRRDRLKEMRTRKYSGDPDEREKQVKADLNGSRADPESTLRPSVEANLHDIIGYSYVVHLHPTVVNGFMCSQSSRSVAAGLFPDALYIPYIDPGYTLFFNVYEHIIKYREQKGRDPGIIFLENHGVFVSADTVEEIRQIYADILSGIEARLDMHPAVSELPVPGNITEILPAVRMMVSAGSLKTLVIRHNSLIAGFYQDEESFSRIAAPFTPDIIVYCNSSYLYVKESETPEKIIGSVGERLSLFAQENGYYPRIILIRGYGLIGVGETWQAASTSLDVYEDLMKISRYTESFGGPRFMTGEQIAFIDSWEVENYRRQVARGTGDKGKVSGRIAIVTGGALGFGSGIAASLYEEGANVVIADINEREGKKNADMLNDKGGSGRAAFVTADVADAGSVRDLIRSTVEMFGGLDLMVSNAGILYAGALEEMSEEVFEKVTRVNYTGYFHCARYASAVMKLQYQHNNNHFTDIVQINSKSGLKGSNRNFAYAGGKFGGIGLTQSFALELIPFKIKVNSICPGNFFEGSLWSDPENGLFVQYLRAGKVPGAGSIDDVKRYYESQVPAGRGCRVEDVMKAVYYVIQQEYETGQAVPVTGGQNMLH